MFGPNMEGKAAQVIAKFQPSQHTFVMVPLPYSLVSNTRGVPNEQGGQYFSQKQ